MLMSSNSKKDESPTNFSDQEDETIKHIEGVYAAALPQQEGSSNVNTTTAPLETLEEGVGDEEEAALIRASLTRTTDVMKVANFLGLAPLVELCGLVIAILLRGRSLSEIQDMFMEIVNTAT